MNHCNQHVCSTNHVVSFPSLPGSDVLCRLIRHWYSFAACMRSALDRSTVLKALWTWYRSRNTQRNNVRFLPGTATYVYADVFLILESHCYEWVIIACCWMCIHIHVEALEVPEVLIETLWVKWKWKWKWLSSVVMLSNNSQEHTHNSSWPCFICFLICFLICLCWQYTESERASVYFCQHKLKKKTRKPAWERGYLNWHACSICSYCVHVPVA